jgi:16S rRNA (guanine527-N7)-methyltransferase
LIENPVEAEPVVAAALFGERIGLARTYTADLARRGEELGLIGPLELPRLWSRHILNCVLIAPLLRPGNVGDVGSGAGLPGMVLAIARPDVEFTLIEPMARTIPGRPAPLPTSPTFPGRNKGAIRTQFRM